MSKKFLLCVCVCVGGGGVEGIKNKEFKAIYCLSCSSLGHLTAPLGWGGNSYGC
jgi:hypothetical protein